MRLFLDLLTEREAARKVWVGFWEPEGSCERGCAFEGREPEALADRNGEGWFESGVGCVGKLKGETLM